MITRRQTLRLALLTTAFTALRRPAFAQTGLSLDLDEAAFETLTTTITTEAGDVAVSYKFYKAIPYVANPVDLAHQSLNISVPVAINGAAVDATNAPILFAVSVGGYMPSRTSDAKGVGEAGPAAMLSQGKLVSNAQQALAGGYVVVEPGARGRSLVDASGIFYGTAPAAIVDLKAAVRWLRHNRGRFAGNTDQIITSGSSAGGALAALLGATADMPAYAPYLKALGAAETSDAVFATAAWCPITDLENADMAYEWNWRDLRVEAGAFNRPLSETLTAGFAPYQASLGLVGQGDFGPLTAETYGDYLTQTHLIPSATAFLAAMTDEDRTTYFDANSQIMFDGEDASFTWDGFLSHVGTRKKSVPAFDALDLTSGENNLFGAGTTEARHFTALALQQASGDPAAQIDADLPAVLAMMNPMPALQAANPARARHWWLRVGAKDTDTSLTVVGNLDAQIRALGDSVSTRYYWDAGHGANEDVTDFIAWIGQTTGYVKP